ARKRSRIPGQRQVAALSTGDCASSALLSDPVVSGGLNLLVASFGPFRRFSHPLLRHCRAHCPVNGQAVPLSVTGQFCARLFSPRLEKTTRRKEKSRGHFS
ncbi:MAG: hypothetical protein WD005_04855, partial [Haliea sp.]